MKLGLEKQAKIQGRKKRSGEKKRKEVLRPGITRGFVFF
jgi:hypothetical protein